MQDLDRRIVLELRSRLEAVVPILDLRVFGSRARGDAIEQRRKNMSEAQLKQRIIQKLESMSQEKLAFVDRFIDSLDDCLRSQRLNQSEIPVDDDQKRLFVRSLRGKYAHAATSSDEFAQGKQEEIDWENRHR
jgi:hypothetical protein